MTHNLLGFVGFVMMFIAAVIGVIALVFGRDEDDDSEPLPLNVVLMSAIGIFFVGLCMAALF